jgi:dTMP kinase
MMGLFIAIEGGDGSGKGTHSELLVDYLREQGKTVHKISFPQYGEPSAYYVERYLNGDYGQADDVPADLGVLTYALDRYAASDTLRSYLSDPDTVVVSDRYMASNLAHQGTKIEGSNEQRKEFYERSMKTEYDILKIPRPDINITLIMPTKLAQQNVDKKEKRGYTELKRDIHEANSTHLDRAKANYEELCRLYPAEFTPVLCTTSDGDLRSIDNIQNEIRSLVSNATNQ